MKKKKLKKQRKPGSEKTMTPKPKFLIDHQEGTGKLLNKVAIITGGDSGIGRAVAIAFAKEGADVVISYLSEHQDAKDTKEFIDKVGRQCLLIPGDISKENHCKKIVDRTLKRFGKIDILVNNAATHYSIDDISKITTKMLDKTFKTNFYSYFFLTKECVPHLKEGSSIINTASVTAYRGSEHLLDYSATKGAIVTFTRSLSANLASKGIRVNGVAPGPIWTPLIVSTLEPSKARKFGKDTPLGRPGQPEEVAPSYVFLASEDASYMTGQFLHPNGGEVINT